MAAPYAALESRVNAAVQAKLANATAVFGAESGDVILDAPDVEAFDVAADVSAVMHCASTLFATLVRGNTITVAATAYRVLDIPLADAGMKRVLLGRA